MNRQTIELFIERLKPSTRIKSILNKVAVDSRLASRMRPRCVRIQLDELLVGDIHGRSNWAWFIYAGDHTRLHELLVDSAYVELLQVGQAGASAEDLQSSRYSEMAHRCVAAFGKYAGATDVESILQVMNSYVAAHENALLLKAEGCPTSTELITVRAISGSGLFEIVDGHHRAASMWLAGEVAVDAALVARGPSGSQRLLQAVHMTHGHELYQPVEDAAVASWPPVRGCTDRVKMLVEFLEEADCCAPGDTYLDLASSYGYFVAAMGQNGFDATGIEVDPLAVVVGRLFYGLDHGSVRNESIGSFLSDSPGQFDVVSCFSILHHFVLGENFGEDLHSPEEFISMVAGVTRKVLFLDTGQGHEDWFRKNLAGWDDEHVEEFVLKNTDFSRAFVLGRDQDSRGRYQKNYARTLFAFMR